MKNKLLLGFTGLVLVVMGTVIGFATITDSPTSDEPPHILSGYVFLRYGHNFIDTEHPLLAKSLAALPLLFQDIKIDLTDPDYTQQRFVPHVGKMFDHSRTFLIYNGNNPAQILFWSRLPMLLLTISFGFVVFLLTKKLFGDLAAILAVIFYTSEPLFLGHGSLVNTDIAAAGFVITVVYALILYANKQGMWQLTFLILALSGALLSKFSTFYLAPLTLILVGYIYWIKKVRPYSHLIFLVAGVVLTISVFYGVVGFQDTGWLGFLPARYLGGLIGSIISLSSNDRFSYLLGESYTGSRFYYFPILLATKTQLLTLAFALVGVVLIAFKKVRLPKTNLILFFTPALVFFLLSLNAKFNIGVRHVSPLYPFLIILAASGLAGTAHLFTKNLSRNFKLSTIALVILLVSSFRLYSVVTTYPHFLSYYNVLGGGTDNGWRVTDDSNYDWGQDVKRLADYVRENNIKSLALDNYSGIYAAEDYYNLPVFQFSPDQTDYKGYVALSTSVIVFHEDKPENYSWIVDNYKPIARAGKSIFIFKIN